MSLTEDTGCDSPQRPQRSHWRQCDQPASPSGKYAVCLLPTNGWVKKKKTKLKKKPNHRMDKTHGVFFSFSHDEIS